MTALTFPVGDPKILHLSYLQYGDEENGKTVYFEAASGEVVLEREPFQMPINGRLNFKTKTVGDDHYDVDVIFDIKSPI